MPASAGTRAASGAGGAAGLAVFDLDGTITRRDTLVPYVLGFLREHPARATQLAAIVPSLLRFVLRSRDRGALKGTLIGRTLGGLGRSELDGWTARFVPQLVARGVWQDALACLARHRAHGDLLVLMSASVDLYVPAIGAALGFGETLCTPVRWNGDRLDGNLAGANLRGAEKARALMQLRARHPGRPITAYGNAQSDLPHLCLADRGVLVNGSVRTRRAARHLGLECAHWR